MLYVISMETSPFFYVCAVKVCNLGGSSNYEISNGGYTVS